MSIQVSGYVVPTGGACTIKVAGVSGAPLTLSRMIGSGAWEVIETEPYPGKYNVFIDAGLKLPGPLPVDQGNYQYKADDGVSSGVSESLSPYVTLQVEGDFLTSTILKCLLAGINNLTLPSGYTRPTVRHEMPKAGMPPMPFIFMMEQSLRQTQTHIGQDVPVVELYPNNTQRQTYGVIARRTWRISIQCRTAGEREFYRDAVLAIFQSILATVLMPIGSDMHHDFMISSGQEAGNVNDPGLYWSEILFSADGTYNVNIMPQFGKINEITSTLTASGTSTIVDIVSG